MASTTQTNAKTGEDVTQLYSRLAQLNAVDDMRERFREAEDFRIFLARHPLVANVNYYRSLIATIRRNPSWFMQYKAAIVEQTKQLDLKLAEDIAKIEVPVQSLLPL